MLNPEVLALAGIREMRRLGCGGTAPGGIGSVEEIQIASWRKSSTWAQVEMVMKDVSNRAR
jgi:hypothetical protein